MATHPFSGRKTFLPNIQALRGDEGVFWVNSIFRNVPAESVYRIPATFRGLRLADPKGNSHMKITTRLFFLGALVIFPQAPARASALTDAAANMHAGQWKEFTTKNLGNDTVLFKNVNGELWYADYSTTWTNYLAWNPGTQELYWVGAPHLVPFAFLRYSAADNFWYNETNVPDCMRIGGYDGCFSHGYDSGTIDPVTGTFYYVTGQQIFAYKIADKAWTGWKQADLLGGFGNAFTWFPELKRLIYVIGNATNDGGWVEVIDPATRKLDTAAMKLQMGGYHNTMEYSAPHHKVYFGGGNDTRDFYSMDSTRKVVKLADAPEILTCKGTSLATDPVSGDPLFLAASNNYYAYKAASDSWVKSTSPPDQLNDTGGSVACLATEIPELGVVFYMSPIRRKAYLYKHAERGAQVNARISGRRAGMQLHWGPQGGLTLFLPPDRDPAGTVEILGLSGRKEAVFPAREQIQLRTGGLSSGPKLVVWSEHGKTVDARLALPMVNLNPSRK
jgi:hypothetical protein